MNILTNANLCNMLLAWKQKNGCRVIEHGCVDRGCVRCKFGFLTSVHLAFEMNCVVRFSSLILWMKRRLWILLLK